MSHPFSINVKDLGNLEPAESVDFFRRLLWAEATKWRIAKSLINVPSNIYASDGGVDAQVKDIAVPIGSGLIKEGLTRYQLKTGDYKLDTNGIRKLLFNEKMGGLKPRVKYCLDNDGTFVVVLFDPAVDNPDRDDVNSLENKMRNVLVSINEAYKKAKIEIIMPNTLAGYVNAFPSLCLELKRLDSQGFMSHPSWAKLPDMRVPLKIGEKEIQRLEDYREDIRKADKAIHIRVNGEPGIGKTRFILELTREEDLAPLVVYCETPQSINSAFLSHICSEDKDLQIILVVDECDMTVMTQTWRILEAAGPRLKLVTIYSEEDGTKGETKRVEITELEGDRIADIIHTYGNFPDEQVKRWVPYCSGSPRVAHVIGQNLRENPQDLTASPDTVPVWERFIAGRDKMNTKSYDDRKEILMWLSLFKKFGYERPNDKEFDLLAKKIESKTKISFSGIHTIIKDMKLRKVLQGKATLYITPKLLHIKLWTWWWNTYGNSSDSEIEKFVVVDDSKNPPITLSHDLIKWYCEMFRYAKESEAASEVVRKLLGSEGPFQGLDFFATGIGARLFRALSEANPEAALRTLERTVGQQSKERLLQFEDGRRVVIDALDRIAMENDLFVDAARLILVLAEAENEKWSNNASGIFAHLFSNSYGKVAPTAAPPELRFPVIVEAINSASKERRLLALKACDAALEAHNWIGPIRDSEFALSKMPDLWMPKTWGEWFDALRRIWKLLVEKLDALEKDERDEALRILLSRTRGLANIPNLSVMVIDTVESLIKRPYVDRKDLLKTTLTILRFEKEHMEEEVTRRWEAVKEELIGKDFSSKMKRYVGMQFLGDLTTNRDTIDPAKPRISELAREAVSNTELLEKELSWLVTKKAENGYFFGYALAENDPRYSLLLILLDAQKAAGADGSAYFLGGYFLHIAEKDLEKYEHELDLMANDNILVKWVPEVTWRAKTTDRSAQRILHMIKADKVDGNVLQMYAIGGAIRNLSENVVRDWIEFLMSRGDFSSVVLAADFCHFYYQRSGVKRELPEELTLKILLDDAFFGVTRGKKTQETEGMQPIVNTTIDYEWSELAKEYVQKYPQKSVQVGYKMLDHLGDDWTVAHGHSEALPVLTQIASIHLEKIWERISKLLGPPIDKRAFHIQQWLRGSEIFKDMNEGFLHEIPLQKILNWVNENVEERAWYLAYFVPKEPFSIEGKICPREVLVHFGDRRDVRNNLRANFETEFFSGSESLHYQSKRDLFLELKKNETNANVRSWLNEYLSLIDQEIKRAENEEERLGF